LTLATPIENGKWQLPLAKLSLFLLAVDSLAFLLQVEWNVS
jgi:hypothetical protein